MKLKYSIQWFGLAALLSLAAFHTSCNVDNSTQDDGPTGVVRAALTVVPADVSCVRIEVQGARFTSQDFDVTPGQNATLLVSGVSTGTVLITVKGFNVACASVGASLPSWVSDPISAQVGTTGTTDVSADLHRNGQINVGITFTDDPTCGMPGGFCPPATCTDGMKDGMETGLDCGGGCKGCAHGEHCTVNGDCGSLFCNKGRCVPTCGDGVQNGTETAVDCGGECGICNGQPCMTSAQCASQTCTNGICVIAPPTCVDGIRNGTETDVDCGGGACPQCLVAQGCGANADCVSGLCRSGLCQPAAPTCSDGIRNGGETDVDCGGLGGCPPCGDGSCHDDKDCASNACVGGMCKASCTDGVRDGTETDVDCGGICNPCAEGLQCSVDTDCIIACVNGLCSSKRCIPIKDSPTGFWRADGDYADQIGGDNGIPTGAVMFAPGIHGQGFLLDGVASAVVIPTASSVDVTGELTIDAWINPTDPYGNGRIVDKIAPFGNDGYLFDLQGFHLRAIIGGEGVSTVATVQQNTFTHVAVTFTPAGNMVLYINGMAAAVTPVVQTAIPSNFHPVIIGADQGGGSLFTGIIDEVRIWKNAVDGKSMQILFGQGRVCP